MTFRMLKTKALLAAVCWSALSGYADAAPRKSVAKPLGISPQQYAASVSGINSCDQFTKQAAILPNAGPLLSELSSAKDSALKKDEFETTTQFHERQQSLWSTRVGDPQRLVIRIPIDTYKMTYNADKGVITIKYLVDWTGSKQRVEFAERDRSRGEYIGTNAFGVSATVTSVRASKDVLLFPEKEILGDRGAHYNPEWDIQMSAEDAKAFKEKASLLVFARLLPPYLVSSSSYSGATLDSPLSLSMQTNQFHVSIRCAVFVSETGAIARQNLVNLNRLAAN